MRERNHRSRVLRSPNVLAGLLRCGKCGAPMHVTYPGVEPKCRFRYYVCNNRYYFKSCDQEYIRADHLEDSVIREIEKLSRWLLGNDLTADAVRYINTQVDAYNEKEQKLQA